MEIKNIQESARMLFFITGGILFLFGFFLHNGIMPITSKLLLLLLDIPLLFFGMVYLLSSIRLQRSEYGSHTESVIAFLALFFFALVLFFQFAYPDLI